MANGLLLRLRERELSASPAERNVIAYVSAHPREVVGLSVRGLADATFSSPSSWRSWATERTLPSRTSP